MDAGGVPVPLRRKGEGTGEEGEDQEKSRLLHRPRQFSRFSHDIGSVLACKAYQVYVVPEQSAVMFYRFVGRKVCDSESLAQLDKILLRDRDEWNSAVFWQTNLPIVVCGADYA